VCNLPSDPGLTRGPGMGQGQYDLASVAVKDDVHAWQHDMGVSRGYGALLAAQFGGQFGDLAHQLGTGELVGVAPHSPTPGGSTGGCVHGGLSSDGSREVLLHRAV